MTATGVPATVPMTIRPLWPSTVGRGKCGISWKEITTGRSICSANEPSPEPSTTATPGRTAMRSRINEAAFSAFSKIPCANDSPYSNSQVLVKFQPLVEVSGPGRTFRLGERISSYRIHALIIETDTKFTDCRKPEVDLLPTA